MPNSIPFPVDAIQTRKASLLSQQLDINNPSTFRPKAHGIHIDLILQQATLTGWLIRNRSPTFSFMKNVNKRRYVVLVDRFLYTFKTEKPDTTYREYLELTTSTYAILMDTCIEIKKKGNDQSWVLQADNTETVKVWLDCINRTIAWLKQGHTGTILRATLLEDHASRISSSSNISIKTSTSSVTSIPATALLYRTAPLPAPPPLEQLPPPPPPPSQPLPSQPLPPLPSSPPNSAQYYYDGGSTISSSWSEHSAVTAYEPAPPLPLLRRKSSLRMMQQLQQQRSMMLPPPLPPPNSLLPPVPSSYTTYL